MPSFILFHYNFIPFLDEEPVREGKKESVSFGQSLDTLLGSFI